VAEHRHGQPAQVVAVRGAVDATHVGRVGRLYESTVPGRGSYVHLQGTSVQLYLEGPDSVTVRYLTEAELLGALRRGSTERHAQGKRELRNRLR
jgi:hypothetical protein